MLYRLGELELAAHGEDCTGRKRRIVSLRLDFGSSEGRDFALFRETHDVIEYVCQSLLAQYLKWRHDTDDRPPVHRNLSAHSIQHDRAQVLAPLRSRRNGVHPPRNPWEL